MSSRDRHSRGLRGPLAPPGTAVGRALRRRRPTTPADFFVSAVSEAVAQVSSNAPEALVGVDVGIEDIPPVDSSFLPGRIPLAAALDATDAHPARVVVYRRPIEHRVTSRRGLRILVFRTVVEQLSALTGIPVSRLDPHGDADDDDY